MGDLNRGADWRLVAVQAEEIGFMNGVMLSLALQDDGCSISPDFVDTVRTRQNDFAQARTMLLLDGFREDCPCEEHDDESE